MVTRSAKNSTAGGFWRVAGDGRQFLCEDVFGTIKGVAGGNFLFAGHESSSGARHGCRSGGDGDSAVVGVILPFPGGIVRRQQGRRSLQEAAGQHQ